VNSAIFLDNVGFAYFFDRWYPVPMRTTRHGIYTSVPNLENRRLYNLLTLRTLSPGDKVWMVRSPDFEI
jgi:hypothetical protein